MPILEESPSSSPSDIDSSLSLFGESERLSFSSGYDLLNSRDSLREAILFEKSLINF